MISMMFLLMVRVSDPLVPRAIFGVLNTLLFFPSGAVYPTAGFPVWLRAMSFVDPFTYVVDALKNLLLKDTGFAGISLDLAILTSIFSSANHGMHFAVQTANLRSGLSVTHSITLGGYGSKDLLSPPNDQLQIQNSKGWDSRVWQKDKKLRSCTTSGNAATQCRFARSE